MKTLFAALFISIIVVLTWQNISNVLQDGVSSAHSDEIIKDTPDITVIKLDDGRKCELINPGEYDEYLQCETIIKEGDKDGPSKK